MTYPRTLRNLLSMGAALGLALAARAAVEPIPLNDHERLGQRFTADMPWSGVWVIVPSWLDAEGGLTLSVWDSPERKVLLGRKVLIDIEDNAQVYAWLPGAQPRGVFYWEIHDRTGETRVGLYADLLEKETDDCAYLDGTPDRLKAFKSGPVYCPGRTFDSVEAMMEALKTDTTVNTKAAACRELAARGTAEAIPVLGELLDDDKLSHMARYALEAMGTTEADRALREALPRLGGHRLVGLINSLGARRDAQSVPELAKLLVAEDPDSARAAAAALGRIGTAEAVKALTRARGTAPEAVRPAVIEGLLDVATATAAGGDPSQQTEAARRSLEGTDLPEHIRRAALCARLLSGPKLPPALLRTQLSNPDATVFAAMLWSLQRGMDGEEVTTAAAECLPELPPDRRILLVKALGHRGDTAALPALVRALDDSEPAVRPAALRAIAGFPGEAALGRLLGAVNHTDDAVRQTAREILPNLDPPAVAAAIDALFAGGEVPQRIAALELASRCKMVAALPRALTALDDADTQVRIAALAAVRELGSTDNVPRLVRARLDAAEPPEQEAAQSALLAVCKRSGPPAAAPVRDALDAASPDRIPALLQALGHAGGNDALGVVVLQLRNPDAAISRAALDVLRNWPDRTVVTHLLAAAREADSEADKILAIRSLVRLAEPGDDGTPGDTGLLTEIMALCDRPEEKRLTLGILGRMASRRALGIATEALADPQLRSEAAIAAVSIAEALPKPGDDDIRTAMEQVLETDPAPAVRGRAEAVLAGWQEQLAAARGRLAGKLPERAPATPARPRRLLLYDVNVVYGGHPSRFAANEAFTLMGEATGAYETYLSRDAEVFRPESLKRFDAVCFNNTVGLPFEDPELKQSLVEFVYGGGGLMGIHGTTFAFIDWGGQRGDTWPEFGTMLGARGGTHGAPDEPVRIRLDDPGHPLNAVFGGEGFNYRDEFFRVQEPYSRDRVRVLFSIDGTQTDLASQQLPDALKRPEGDYPLAWIRHYGRGRTFYCTIGHNPAVFEDPAMLGFYLGAIQFILGDLPAPTVPSARLDAGTRAQEALGWRLGMTAYSLHKYTFFETMEKTRDLGLSYINGLCFQKVSEDIPKNFGPELTDDEIEKVRLKLDATHTRLLTHYIGTIPGDEEGCRQAFEFARKLGIEVLIAEPDPAALDTIERFCDEYDIKVGLHNHGPDQSPVYWHPEKIVEVCRGRSPRIGACADIGYWIRAGIDPVEGVKILGDRLITIQMHDLDTRTAEGRDVPWGTGKGGTRALLETIRELGVRPAMFGLEYSDDWLDNMPEMAECAAFFNRVAVDLAK